MNPTILDIAYLVSGVAIGAGAMAFAVWQGKQELVASTIAMFETAIGNVTHETIRARGNAIYLRDLAAKFLAKYPRYGDKSDGYQFLLREAIKEEMSANMKPGYVTHESPPLQPKMATALQSAVHDARTDMRRQGHLTDAEMDDIAKDYEVPVEELKKALDCANACDGSFA